ncbi:MAG TPA: dipeptidase [Allosphingosinicella sp.]|jgi:membrane dipeptidase
MRRLLLIAAPLLAAPLAAPLGAQPPVEPGARYAHDEMLVIDTHLDIAARFDSGEWDFAERHRFEWDGSQVDLPRMIEGGLDGGFFVIYTAQGELNPAAYAEARSVALNRAAAIRRVIGENRDQMGLALTADDAERLHREGKRIAFMSIENSWPLGEDLTLLQTFHRLGVRMAGPVHSRNNQLADSTTDTPRWNGLSPMGRNWVSEMNRLGMLIDGSHSSDAAFDQLLQLSRVPIVLSHSGPRAINNHPRNLDDERMRRLARAGGVMFMNTIFLAPSDSGAARDSIEERQKNWQRLSSAERRRLLADRTAREAQQPFTAATFDLFMRSMLHTISIMGIDHVGLGADWDGGGGVQGMEDISLLPRITERLRREGFSDRDIAKVMGGNLIRVMRQAQAFAGRQR